MRTSVSETTTQYPNANARVTLTVFSDGTATARAFSGKRTKHDFYIQFRSVERAEKYIADYIAGLEATIARKAAEKAAEKAAKESFVNPYNVGDILYKSWGYEQTNIDYFQVVAVKGRKITIREIAHRLCKGEEGFMQGRVKPVINKYIGEPKEKIVQVQVYNGQVNHYISSEYGSLHKWDGQPKWCSWYA